ncbi:putative late blight resistance protein homolog R1B-16 [Salvia miltiorrhiza]|uniref:putative late blight resistance protein homolog R1B-16 n=1 Tax=Salvia miltiorrhiza TaxID=226208 RepID=UPI0025AC7008|nr:putative late blight resistance protein homolog R1B-16 [Salvia miltiorrhiza]
MAAYAAVVSLMNNLEQIGNHPRLSSCFDDNQIQSLGEKLAFLLEFVEGVGIASEEVKGLERRIASAAHAAEDVIESRVVDQIHAGFQDNGPIFSIDLQMIMQGMSLIQEEVAKVEKERPYQVQQPTRHSRAGRFSSERNFMLGFDEVHLQLLDRLTGGTRDRNIIPIVGMGGTGKTTLAKHCYEHHLTKEHFDVRAWASVSLDYNVRGLLLELLSCLIGSTNKVVESTVDELGEGLHKHLTRRRYLIILDDMWSVECWNQIKYFLPDNNNGSRIIITTRDLRLAYQFSYVMSVHSLSVEDTWILLCHNVFGHEDCPRELKDIGKIIAEHCQGLPLAVTLVGAILRESSMTREYWEHVAQNIGSRLNHDMDDGLRAILMLSYNALPAYLKPCFLYLGIFPADQEFSVSRIIKLWVGEGFLKPHVGRTLEDVAEGYMKELIDRSLIVVSTRGLNGKPKNCILLDPVRELCLRIVYMEKFLSFVGTGSTPAGTNSERHYVALDSIADKHKDPQFFHAMESSLLARTLICESPALLSCKSRLLRVVTEVYSDSLETTLQQVNLRFLAFESICAPIGWIRTYELPSSISLLWNVQTLIMDGNIEEVVAPSEIWEMPQLRHLCFNRIRLPEPPASDDDDLVVLRNLQTLRTALDFNCSEEVCKRMPNIRKLGIFYDDFSGEGQNNSWYCIDHVGYFAELESLSCCFHRVPDRDDLVQNLKFPISLRKLILQDCELHWDDLSVIGSSLPNLEVLKLKCQSVRGAKWETVEGEFPSLRILEIDSCYLIYWFSESSHFPRLEKLVLRRLYRLNEIPSEIGYAAILGNISVFECSISAAISAARRLKKDCVIRVGFRKEKEVAEFRAKLELEGLRSYGLQIDEL